MLINLDHLPRPSARNIAVHVTPAAERALRSGHPWLFEGAIRKQSREGAPGDLAVIFDGNRDFLAIGLYDPASPIHVKVLQHRQQARIDETFFAARVRDAIERRDPLNTPTTNAYRLIHGENDGLPGLVVDRYAATLVLKLYTSAWLPHLKGIIKALDESQPHKRLILRASRNIQADLHQHALRDGLALRGDLPDAPVTFVENGLHFAADVVHGHKTGFFFDQRENRARVRDLSAGQRVLDVFAYSGGFSVYAAAGGATAVTSLDISGPALAAAQANMEHNQANSNVAACTHRVLVSDAFDGLADLCINQRETFDLVIVDPPSFAKSADEINRALAAYARLTPLALDVLAPGGTLLSASCSSRVTAEAFFNVVHRAAAAHGRPLDKIEQTGHALDHPVGFPEGAYLKCLYARTHARL